jgi:DNA (cytosine-5)-methyltransferase 1
MVGNAVSVPMAKWIAERLIISDGDYEPSRVNGLSVDNGWPAAAWGYRGKRGGVNVSEWPVVRESSHLASFLHFPIKPLSKKATSGFYSRLRQSGLRYEQAFARDLAHHLKHAKTD